MKKLVLILLFLSFSINPAMAEGSYGFRGPLNIVQSKILEKIVSSQIEKKFSGSVKAKIKSYGAKALRNGIFKSADIRLKNIKIDGITISDVELKTTSVNNKLDVTDVKNVKLLSTIDGEFVAELSNEDLKSILVSKFYQNELAKLNSQLAPYMAFNIKDISCESDRLVIKLQVNSMGMRVNTTCSSCIHSENGNVVLKDIKLSKKLGNMISPSVYGRLSAVNPIKTTIKALGNSNLSVKPSEINIVNDKIQISGIIRIYKD